MHSCPRCQRANPDQALYCYYDGVNLKGGAAPAAAVPEAPSRLPFAFVFASGRRCETIDDLLRGCQDEWTTAAGLLRQGTFRQFFTGTGRLDLAKMADEAAR